MANNLVEPLRSVSLKDARAHLAAAHACLVQAALRCVPRFQEPKAARWGTGAKRAYVALSGEDRPALVPAGVTAHSFAEVMNQCATMERLIDAVGWAQQELTDDALVSVCHPTTSSTAGEEDHDLVVVGPGGNWRFEISDVARAADGNQKERKDLATLGLVAKDGTVPAEWPPGRSFLVVAPEFAAHLRRPTRHALKQGLIAYREMSSVPGDTVIFEVVRGGSAN